MQLYRIIKQPLEHLTAFVMLFQRLLRGQPLTQRGILAKPIQQRMRYPGAPGIAFLLCGLFPTVQAWSPFKGKNEDEIKIQPYTDPILRLLNKQDKKLRQDIYSSDKLYDDAKYEEAFELLSEHFDKREPEVLWRLGRLRYEKAKISKSKEEKQRIIEEAYDLVFKSMACDEKNFSVHKWMAILKNELSTFKGIKEQILESVNVKNHMLRAAELNPDDPTSIYLLGHWCYTVADIPWYQRKVAETLFATPPECTFQEAYKHFLRAEYTRPGFYSMNLLMLAKTSVKTGELAKAEQYLEKLQHYHVKNEDDFLAKQEGRKIREKLFKATSYKTDGAYAEENKS